MRHHDEDEHLPPNHAAANVTAEVAKLMGAATVRLQRLHDRTLPNSIDEHLIAHDIARLGNAWKAFTPATQSPLPTIRRRSTPTERLLNARMDAALAPADAKSAASMLFMMFELLTNPMVQEKPGTDDLTVSIHFKKRAYEDTCEAMATVLRANGYDIQ